MISTIGSLVQETSTRVRWLIATGLYILACLGSSLLLGALLSGVGQLVHSIRCSVSTCVPASSAGTALVGLLAVAYALSDVGVIRLPRPRLMYAVPFSWWRWWKPYGAAIAYGAALGLGVMTRVQFGAFYVLCLWCVLQGNVAYGAALMGIYGVVRASVLIPASCVVYAQRTNGEADARIQRILTSIGNVKLVMAIVLVLFGAQMIASLFF